MKIFVLLCLSLIAGSKPGWAGNLIPELERGEIRAVTPPLVARQTLPNGLRLWTYESHELPLFKAVIYLPGGAALEEPRKAGLTSLLAETLAAGGTAAIKPGELDALLDQKAMTLEAEAGRELTQVAITSLAEDWERALEILWQVVQQPRFDPERFQLTKDQSLNQLKRAEDLPHYLAQREFLWALYGKKSPWGKQATRKSVARVQRQDLLEWHARYFNPSTMVLVVSGDFRTAPLRKQVESTFGVFAAAPVTIAQVAAPTPVPAPAKTVRIHRKITQTHIVAGGLALPRSDPDRYAYTLLHYILGGSSFISRLGEEIRVRHGWAYSVDSHWEDNPQRGHFEIAVQTKVESRDLVLQRLRSLLQELITTQPITATELQEAQKSFLQQYLFWFESPFEFPFRMARQELLGYPENYLRDFPRNIRKVTLEQIRTVSQKYLHPDQLTTVLVGP